MDELLKIEKWIESLDFWRWEEGEDVDEEQWQWMAARRSATFDSQWQRVLIAVQMQEFHSPLSEAECLVVARIRENAMRKANQWSFVDGLSALAAEDFELLARATRVGVCDFWLDELQAEYEAGRFPHGRL